MDLIFQPTPPVGAETEMLAEKLAALFISTHSARGGGDGSGKVTAADSINFNPLRPWGRRPKPNRACNRAF